MIRIHQVKTTDPEQIEEKILKKLNMKKSDLLSWSIHRRSVDARGQKVLFSYVIDANVKHEKKYLKNRDVVICPDETFRFEPEGTEPLENRPVVAGFGPAGIFAALLLAQYGYRPLIVERGADIDQRQKDVDLFWKEGLLNPESNVQFGMGGAGAFSDGKLTTRSKDPKSRRVYEELIRFGADPDIAIDQHPHVGTDGFIQILKNIRQEIESLGGEFAFGCRLDEIVVENDRLEKVVLSDGRVLPCQALIAAMGHSASDTIGMFYEKGLKMEPKSFAAGVRIEHLQTFINKAMLKDQAFNPALIPARYQLTHTASTGRGVYTFCMCPGGYVIPSSCQPETVVVNGMSYSDRAGENANAALLIQCPASEFSQDVFAGEHFLEELEKKAYALSGSYKAPVQLAKDFVNKKKTTQLKSVKPTYALGVEFADFNELFDPVMAQSLQEALLDFEKKVPGFLEDAVLTGVETRSSSTIRLLRDPQSLMSSIYGLYPCGEGAGYAGGIMTSAIDGMKCAMALMNCFAIPNKADYTKKKAPSSIDAEHDRK